MFEGLADTPAFRKYPGDDAKIAQLASSSWAQINDDPGWMYVAPRTVPPEIKAVGVSMVTSDENEIIVARSHLANSPSLDLYLDIIHEFLHILQREQGRSLWLGPKVPYVDRPTEIEAYAFSVVEARRMGVPDSYLRKYLRVSWVSESDHRRLLRHVGVSATSKSN